MRSSTLYYRKPSKETDWVVLLYDGYSAYLIIVDGTSRRLWVFLTQSKEPPLDIVRAFTTKFGIGGGLVRTDQGGKLARSDKFRNTLQNKFQYVAEPTGLILPHRTALLKLTMINWQSRSAPSYMGPVSLPSFGPLHYFTQPTCTIDLSTLPQK